MATAKPVVKAGQIPTKVSAAPAAATGIDPAGATPYGARPGADPAYTAYLAYATAVAHLWTVELGVPKSVQDVIAAGGGYGFDPSLSAASYQNLTASVTDNTGPHGWTGGAGATTSPTSTPDAPPHVASPQALIDNGISSIAEYGFGEGNRYGVGAPAGGYQNYNVTAANPTSGLSARHAGPMQNSTTGASASTAGLSTAQRDAWGYLKGILDQYGLGSLSQFVITELTAGRSQDEIALDLQGTPEFKQAFPEIAARQAAGLPAISPGEIVSYRNSAVQLMRAAGLPEGFFDNPKDLQTLIGSDVSLSELNDRIQAAKDATYNIDPAAQTRLFQEFGLAPGSGALAAFYLDPDRALPILQRQLAAAQIGGAADQVGYRNLNNATALDLAQAGVTAQQARSGFNTLGNESELFTGLPGQQEQGIGQGQQLAAQFLGNVNAQQTIERRRRGRLATFADGGSYAATSKGVGGLGSSDSQ